MSIKQMDNFATVIKAVCRHFEIRVKLLESKGRQWHIVWPRFVAIALVLELTGVNRRQVALLFGVDYDTVRHAQRRVQEECEVNRKALADVEALRTELHFLKELKELQAAA